MNFNPLKKLSDQNLHQLLKSLINYERKLLTKILHHLREVERRKLYSDFNCSSLFDYTVRELGYSENQAHRRIQAMRLLREIPEVEEKITSGKLNLSNLSQAQSVFNKCKKDKTQKPLNKSDKVAVLNTLENKSAREGQKQLLALFPNEAKPTEREKVISENQVEIKCVLDSATKEKLEEVRALLGPKGTSMTYAELIAQMAVLSVGILKAKRFGKQRSLCTSKALGNKEVNNVQVAKEQENKSSSKENTPANPRYISAEIRYQVWQRDLGRCTKCHGNRNIQFDHKLPVAMGGKSTLKNLRLLCFHCNQREAMKRFGVNHMLRMQNGV